MSADASPPGPALGYRPSLAAIADRIAEQVMPGRCCIVAISGVGGSGKTTLATALGRLVDFGVIGADEFATAAVLERSSDWRGIDRDRLAREVIGPARRGASTLTYASCRDWEHFSSEPATCSVGAGLIIEGVGLFHPSLADAFDLALWLDVDLELATARGIARDGTATGSAAEAQWRAVWRANEIDFLTRFDPIGRADLVISPA
ncbi:MAG: phosphoglycerate transporter [Actinomycetota bacterium]|nr:phosphoglycerate transporter [Actinomycetota bacterium]